ncbi:hypothetical protein SPRG_14772 [Saprolegnia parasitica CBS 223.65]|uniref:Uncharacterized protein n=1 Tax=Saprolegnia parasitica (strain CBS 223.65) TaxID=695850 RepID=A0A067BYT5_SAPPC|nr:hypothetical protein SPRG_14772 [Saprolegnia parasitica CBS 223.65]KDO19692.1 hypothetical protein SPRG_14772 [Saprolegnia parasitica CBS 223.65]|eukprot:XP_012209609.1 hypothetical protein SPRG_14772 [Saprolegnia parasitica CBS 223.65]
MATLSDASNSTREIRPPRLRAAVFRANWTDSELRGENLGPDRDYDNLAPAHRPWNKRRVEEWERSAISREHRDWDEERRAYSRLQPIAGRMNGIDGGQVEYNSDDALYSAMFLFLVAVVMIKFVCGSPDYPPSRRYRYEYNEVE